MPVPVSALNRKLARELWRQRGQLASIAAVVAVGIMTVLTMRGTYESLVLARDENYAATRFPHLWVQMERAPEAVRRRIEELPGVSTVQTRISFMASLDIPNLDTPALGQFVSLPSDRRPSLGDIHITAGRYLLPGRHSEVIVSKKFAAANGYTPGDSIRATINGRQRKLEIVGTAVSAEHAYAVPPGAIFPDDKRYGIVWMSRDALGPAYDMDGAFNEVLLSLADGANEDEVVSRLNNLLRPYGGLGAFGRERQPSHLILEGELAQNRTMGTAIPVVFLAVAAFLLNLVLGRMIATQRSEIAVLKAFGYSDFEVGFHYLRFALSAVFVGTIVGIGLGYWLGHVMVDLYAEYFDFPTLMYRSSWTLVAIAAGTSGIAATLGALGAVRRAVSLPPAEAMRPEPPTTFRPGPLERLGIGKVLNSSWRMILRNVERRPVRSALSSVGVAFAVSILVIGMFMFDGVDLMMRLQFEVSQREDLTVTFNRPLSQGVRHEMERLDGVTRVEPFRSVPVRLRSGHRERELGVMGMEVDGRLRRIVTAQGNIQPLPAEGLMVSAVLARQLSLTAGDLISVEVLEGERRTAMVPITGLVEDFVGISAYMELGALNRLARGGNSFSGAFLAVDQDKIAALNLQLKKLPAVASVASPKQTLQLFEDQLEESLFISVFFLLGFSGVIAIAVIYNGARIALSERGRELASLRVLGLTRREVAVLLLGEQAITTLVAIPLGWGLGYLLAAAVAAGMQTESYRIPFVISMQTFGWAGVFAIVAAVLSGLLVRRRLNRMDLIAVLKTRE